MKKVLIFLEKGYEKYTLGLLKTAGEMYGEQQFHATAFSIDGDLTPVMGHFDELIKIEGDSLENYDVGAITDFVEELQKKENYDSILMLATHMGRMLAPRAAMRLGVGIVADVTEIHRHKEGGIEMVRPAFSGKLMAGIMNVSNGPIMMSIRPGVFEYNSDKIRDTRLRNIQLSGKRNYGIRRIEHSPKPVSTDIRDSDVIVSGGGGILRNFDCLDELAARLGGMKGASRKVVDSGTADRSIQVGQSGKVVHPKLYMAIGIYGALQHVAGLQNVEHIIAVNTNKDAPICSLADIVVEGDGAEFVNKLIKRIDSD